MARFLPTAAALAAVVSFTALPAMAQDYFMPGQQHPAAPAPARPAPRPAPPAPRPIAPPMSMVPPQAEAEPPPPLNVPLPPVPELPPLPKGNPPPAPVVGVLGVPEVMRASTAAQQVEKIIGERRDHLNEDAQKEQQVWRDMQQSLANDHAKLSADQQRSRERELQERITNAQKTFRDRNRIIQEAAQYALGQIERTLIGVIRQVAESRGMNLVLHRAQVALNVNEFDITEQVTEQLNKVLPSVTIPPEGVSPVAEAQKAQQQAQQDQKAAPATAPAAAAPAAAAPAAPAPAAAPAAAPKK